VFCVAAPITRYELPPPRNENSKRFVPSGASRRKPTVEPPTMNPLSIEMPNVSPTASAPVNGRVASDVTPLLAKS
jgi:hypothetical protein